MAMLASILFMAHVGDSNPDLGDLSLNFWVHLRIDAWNDDRTDVDKEATASLQASVL